jgi:16S rRNA (cytidine1402-2'-O)-methyltransferase
MKAHDADEEETLPQDNDAIIKRASAHLARQLAQRLAPGLYLVSTPIGNLGDLSFRALATLVRADHVFCEDTRVSLKLFSHFGVRRRLDVYQDHNADRARPRILEMLASGQSVALISDAGTPLISDPGCKLVREARRLGAFVTSVPGPSAVLAALAASGLPTDAFFFAGFLPARETARKKRLEELAQIPGTLVFYETANRLAAAMADIRQACPGREPVIAREITKLHEEFIPGDRLDEVLREGPLRGEIVVLAPPPVEQIADEEKIVSELQRHMKRLSLREAVDLVARELKTGRKRVYSEALKLKVGENDHGQGDD